MTNWFQDHPAVSVAIMGVSAVGFVLSMWNLKRVMRWVNSRDASLDFERERKLTADRGEAPTLLGHAANEYFKASVHGWKGWVTLVIWLVFGMAMVRVTKGVPERPFIVVPPFLFAALILFYKLSDRNK